MEDGEGVMDGVMAVTDGSDAAVNNNNNNNYYYYYYYNNNNHEMFMIGLHHQRRVQTTTDLAGSLPCFNPCGAILSYSLERSNGIKNTI